MAPGGDHLGPLEARALEAIGARPRTTREIASVVQRTIGQARAICAALSRRGFIDQARWGDPWRRTRGPDGTARDGTRAP